MCDFVHLHNHSQFSLLDGHSSLEGMMKKCAKHGMKGIALTDHGNMFGAFKFASEAKKHGVKPIIGCEFYLVEDMQRVSFSRKLGEKDVRYHQLLVAKNNKGYENLCKLNHAAYKDGFYRYPRIDKALLKNHAEGLIATSCCIGAEIPQAIIKRDEVKAENLLKWWIDIFGDDFYIELQRHKGLENIDGTGISQEYVNQVLLKFAKKYNLKVIATNDSHYVDEEDADIHDTLLCINTKQQKSKVDRFKFPSKEFYIKSPKEMEELFKDLPCAISNTIEVFDKVDTLDLKQDIILPVATIPQGYASEMHYLRDLSFRGAKRRFGRISKEINTRLQYELEVIEKTGYAGYFLIVQDLILAAKKLDVFVGSARGSAAGSLVSYCIGITKINPMRYNLLFERFLNPDRISMPDIDVDFDDENRHKILDYIANKYGFNHTAHISTYTGLNPRSSIKDIARAYGITAQKANAVSKAFPMGESFNTEKDLSQFQSVTKSNGMEQVVQEAKILEGGVRGVGVHACGVIISPKDLRGITPLKTDKRNKLAITQFDNSVVEDAGLLKMDILGLKTLTIIRKTMSYISEKIDIDNLEICEKTRILLEQADTVGVFQFESDGMRSLLKNLKPESLEEIAAISALYRPASIKYIDEYISRKRGLTPIRYDLPIMEDALKETYGITVYQEQVMILSQKIAGFTKGQADTMRKGMGKKKKEVIDALYPLFIQGGTDRGYDKPILEKIWKDWQDFASYAFNKSHAIAYATITLQTAYLKANYAVEFYTACLNSAKNTEEISKYIYAAKTAGIKIQHPNINATTSDFYCKDGSIFFGLAGIKGVGEKTIKTILENAPYKTIFDLMQRVSKRILNKSTLKKIRDSGALTYIDNHCSTKEEQFDALGIWISDHPTIQVPLNIRERCTTVSKMRDGENYLCVHLDSQDNNWYTFSDNTGIIKLYIKDKLPIGNYGLVIEKKHNNKVKKIVKL